VNAREQAKHHPARCLDTEVKETIFSFREQIWASLPSENQISTAESKSNNSEMELRQSREVELQSSYAPYRGHRAKICALSTDDLDSPVSLGFATGFGTRQSPQRPSGRGPDRVRASAHGERVQLVSLVHHQRGAAPGGGKVGRAVDAGLARRDALQTPHRLDADGHDLMVVKGNQPALAHELALVFQAARPALGRGVLVLSSRANLGAGARAGAVAAAGEHHASQRFPALARFCPYPALLPSPYPPLC
jgi:hypothetical protein